MLDPQIGLGSHSAFCRFDVEMWDPNKIIGPRPRGDIKIRLFSDISPQFSCCVGMIVNGMQWCVGYLWIAQGLLYPMTSHMPLNPVHNYPQAAWNPWEKTSRSDGTFQAIIMIVESQWIGSPRLRNGSRCWVTICHPWSSLTVRSRKDV